MMRGREMPSSLSCIIMWLKPCRPKKGPLDMLSKPSVMMITSWSLPGLAMMALKMYSQRKVRKESPVHLSCTSLNVKKSVSEKICLELRLLSGGKSQMLPPIRWTVGAARSNRGMIRSNTDLPSARGEHSIEPESSKRSITFSFWALPMPSSSCSSSSESLSRSSPHDFFSAKRNLVSTLAVYSCRKSESRRASLQDRPKDHTASHLSFTLGANPFRNSRRVFWQDCPKDCTASHLACPTELGVSGCTFTPLASLPMPSS
mmetsp:Transcript_64717/g.150492  ORF Transcript_64717/g.150492 Transcript_64717/m.150492 type:complete len:260 (+) Transcript_64717:458-1237(+)